MMMAMMKSRSCFVSSAVATTTCTTGRSAATSTRSRTISTIAVSSSSYHHPNYYYPVVRNPILIVTKKARTTTSTSTTTSALRSSESGCVGIKSTTTPSTIPGNRVMRTGYYYNYYSSQQQRVIKNITNQQQQQQQQSIRIQNYSTTTSRKFSHSTSSSTSIIGRYNELIQNRFSSPLLHRLLSYVKILRIPMIAAGIYSIGYHQGVIESHRNPYQFRNELLQSLTNTTSNTTTTTQDPFIILNEQQLRDVATKKSSKQLTSSTNMTYQIGQVGLSVLQVARDYCHEQLKDAINSVNAKYLTKEFANDTEAETFIVQEYTKDKDVMFWTDAIHRLDGVDYSQYNNNNHPIPNPRQEWEFIFLNDNDPNAFVTELLPRIIFINSGLLNFSKTVDEIAFVLGHEIAHLIYGHSSQKNNTDYTIRSMEIVLLSLDPSAGLLTLVVIGLLATVGKLVRSGFSRECELEADQLGVTLSALAGYDTEAGCKFMYRLQQIDGGTTSSSSSISSWLQTHPPCINRAKEMYKLHTQLQSQQSQTNKRKTANEQFVKQARIAYDVWQSSGSYGRYQWEK